MRTWLMGGLLVLLGILAVTLLMTFRVDVEAAARSGPRWRRKLIGAGLAALVTLGLLPTTHGAKAKSVDATCYVMADTSDLIVLTTPEQLAERINQLERLAASDRLDPAVTAKLLDTIEAELRVFPVVTVTMRVQPTDRDENAPAQSGRIDRISRAKLSAEVTAQIARIRAKLAAASQPANATLQQVTDRDLAATAEWRRLTATWTEAAEIAAGKKGLYPFNEKGKKRLLDAMTTVSTDIEKLRGVGTLSDAEAGLLSRELVTLRVEVARMRPTELENATCYMLMLMAPPAQASTKRLTERLPLLESMASSSRLHLSVAAKVLDTIEADANLLADQKQTESLSDADRAKAAELSAKAKTQVERIRARLAAAQGGGSLEDSPGWKTIVNAWTTAGTLADKGSTTAQRRDADKLLDEARLKAKELAATGLLSKAEAELLCADADRLHERIYATMPTDSEVTCYVMAYVPPAKESLERLNKRLPLIKQLAADGTLHPAAVRKVLPVIEADLKTLSDAKETSKLDSTEQAQAKKARDEVETTLIGIEKALGDGR